MRRLVAKVGGLEIRNRPRSIAAISGLYFDSAGFEGWEVRPPAIGADVESPGSIGDLMLPIKLGGKNISASGSAIADTEARLVKLADQFNAVGTGGKHFRVVVDSLGRQLWGMAKLADAAEFNVRDTDISASFLLQLRMSDPRRFGEPIDGESGRLPFSAAPVEVINRGNWQASPVVQVRALTNMLSGYTLHANDRWFRVSAPLPAGQVHEVDMRTEFVRRNGLIVNKAKHSGQGWHLPPKVPVTVWLEPHAGTGQMSPYFLPTYL